MVKDHIAYLAVPIVIKFVVFETKHEFCGA